MTLKASHKTSFFLYVLTVWFMNHNNILLVCVFIHKWIWYRLVLHHFVLWCTKTSSASHLVYIWQDELVNGNGLLVVLAYAYYNWNTNISLLIKNNELSNLNKFHYVWQNGKEYNEIWVVINLIWNRTLWTSDKVWERIVHHFDWGIGYAFWGQDGSVSQRQACGEGRCYWERALVGKVSIVHHITYRCTLQMVLNILKCLFCNLIYVCIIVLWRGSPNIEMDEHSFMVNRERAVDYLNSLDKVISLLFSFLSPFLSEMQK